MNVAVREVGAVAGTFCTSLLESTVSQQFWCAEK